MPNRSDPTVLINDVSYSYLPNSVKSKLGMGEQNVDAASGGGGQIEVNVTENAETKISEIKFDMYSTTENEAAFKTWKQSPGANTVILSSAGAKPLTGTLMTCTNDPEWEHAASGKVSIEFKGAPLT